MNEINITELVKSECSELYSNNVATLGNNAAQITWNNAKNCELTFVTSENKQDFIDHFKEIGFSEDTDNWPLNELNALFIQEVSSDINELSDYDSWEEIEKDQESGVVSGRIFKTDDNEYYFYIGM